MSLGRELVIARKAAGGGFALLCITEQRSLSINNEKIDITKPDCLNPGSKLVRSLKYGMQSIDFSGQGAFVDNATMKAVAADAINQVTEVYQLTIPGLGTLEGDALLDITFSGDKTNELQSDISFSMSGVILFVPEA